MFSFCSRPATYTPIYEDRLTLSTASVNAGDYNLYVGGGAINRAFAQVLKLPARNAYQQLHRRLLQEAQEAPGRLVQLPRAGEDAGLLRELRLAGAFGRVPGRARGPVGAAFVDVFEAARRPLSDRNVAMLYVVGPKGQGAPGGHGPTVAGHEAFLGAVQDLGTNAMLAVREYNRLAGAAGGASEGALPRIEALQWCLVSGGVYRHPQTTKLDVALATVRGLLVGASDPAGGVSDAPPLVRFAYDEGVFEEAVQLVTGT